MDILLSRYFLSFFLFTLHVLWEIEREKTGLSNCLLPISLSLLWERAVSHHHRLPGKLTLYSFPFWLYSRFVKHSGRDLFLSFLSMTHAQENTFKNTMKNGIRIDSHCSTFMTLKKKIYVLAMCAQNTICAPAGYHPHESSIRLSRIVWNWDVGNGNNWVKRF